MKKLVAPAVVGSQVRYGQVLAKQLEKRPRWLDLGCGHQFLPRWAWKPDPAIFSSLPRLVGVDGDFESLRQHPGLKDKVSSDILSLPFKDESFDLITANMVVEHVLHPEQMLREVRRVLAPGGVFLFHTPNRASPLVTLAACFPERLKRSLVGYLEDRCEADIYPTAYEMNTVRAIRQRSAEAGFHIESCELVVTEAITQRLGPLAFFELLYIRLTQTKPLERLRPDLIVVLRPN